MKVAIVGGGVAGITVAKTIKESQPKAEVKIYGGEVYPYYSKIRLPQLLAGKTTLKEIYMYPPRWYPEKGLQINLGKKVTQIDPSKKVISLVNGEKISYDKLLLATGSHPFLPPIKGNEKKGVFTFNSASDALKIRDYAKEAKKAVVVGGGVLGLESAAALRHFGLEVTVVEIYDRLLPKQLDEEGAKVLKNQIEQLGIVVVLGAQVQEIYGNEAATGIFLKDGRKIRGEVILISAGIRSNLSLAKEAGLEVEKGVIVNDYLETSHPDIFAAGDVAEHQGRVYGIIPPAIEQARVAALNMLQEKSREYKGSVPSNTLKVAGVNLTSIGLVNPVRNENISNGVNPENEEYEELKMKDEQNGIYKKLVFKDNKAVGAIILGERKDAAIIRRIITDKIDISNFKAHLFREDFDLRQALGY